MRNKEALFSTGALMRIRRVFSHFSHWFETVEATWSLCTFFYSFPLWCALNPPNVRKERFVADLLVYVYPVAVITTAHRVKFASMYLVTKPEGSVVSCYNYYWYVQAKTNVTIHHRRRTICKKISQLHLKSIPQKSFSFIQCSSSRFQVLYKVMHLITFFFTFWVGG